MSVTEQIKARIDIVSYIDRHVPGLKKSGKYFKACCPFHEEETPSFVVNAERNTWHCFGACSEGGDIFTFYEKYHHVEFKVALEELAREAGVIIPKYTKPQQIRDDEQRQYRLLTALTEKFHHYLTDTKEAWFVREYLKNRNLTTDSIDHWQLGYAPARNIIPELLDDGHRLDDLLELGIAYRTDGGQVRSRFYNRLMFPIADAVGQVVGFGARALGKKQRAKYINSSESKLFKKSELLYGWHQARDAIRKERKVVVVEGYMDVIQAHQAGTINAVGQMGTALTEDQINTIRRHSVPAIVLCLDGDPAGRQATEKAIDTLIKYAQTKDIRIVNIPYGHDPDSLIQEGLWHRALEEDAVPVVFYMIDHYSSKLPRDATLAQRHAVANDLIPKLFQLETDMSRMWAIQKLAFHLDLNGQALVETARRLMHVQNQITVPKPQTPQLHPSAREYPLEAYVIACLLDYPAGYHDIVSAYQRMDIEMLNRNDFMAFGDVYNEIVSVIESGGLPYTVIDLDITDLTDVEPDREDIVYNAVRLRFNHIEQRLRDVMELRDLERFNQVLYERETLRQRMESQG